MLVSGGQILAIDHVVRNKTLVGDGSTTPLGVNTDVIATTALVSATSAKLQNEIDTVSGKFETSAASISAALKYLHDHEPVVSAGKNIKVTPVDVDGTIHYIVSAMDIVPAVNISGRNGISVVNDDNTTWIEYSGTDDITYSAGKNIDIYQQNGKWYISADVPDVSNFLTSAVGYEGKALVLKDNVWVPADYVTDEDIQKLSATIANTYLSASLFNTYSASVKDKLDELTDVTDVVKETSANWNEASAFAAHSADFMLSAKLNTFEKDGRSYISGYDNIPFFDKDTLYTGGEGINVDIDTHVISITAEYLSANALDDLSGKWESVYDTVDANSAVWNAHSALSATKLDASESAKFMKIADLQSTPENKISGYGESAFYYPPFPEIPEYSGKDGIKVEDYIISISADYLSANALDELSGKWEDTANTVSTASAAWNEASAFAANSGKFVTSASFEFENDLAYFLKKQEDESMAWSGVDLSDLGKIYPISSLTPDLVSAGISADEEENPIYVISAVTPEQVTIPEISGNKLSAWKETVEEVDYYKINGADIVGHQGISAEYNAETNQWDVGISANNCYASYAISMKRVLNRYAPDVYTEQYNVGPGITYDSVANELSVDEGMWHVTIRAKVAATIDTNYYDVTLTCNSNSTSIQLDNSYQHEEYLSLDYDLLNQNGTVKIEPVITNAPANAYVTIERLQLHRVIAGYTVNEGAGQTYYAGDGINIEDDYIKAQVSSGLKIGVDNGIEVQPGSGVYIDENNKISLRLGKGLAFSGDGDVISIETDGDVNEVVNIVENLKQELDGKLTTNMNISDAKAAGCPWDGDTSNINNIAASFFTIPLQHNLSSASEISFFATQGLGQSDADPLVVGILEYNFDYFEADASAPNGVKTRSQTQWIADTGPIWYDTPDINGNVLTAGAGRYTYKLKNVTVGSASDITGTDGTVYHNEFGPALRSDRAYYLALYTYSPNSYKYFLCDEGYAGGINNTDPAISFRKTGTNYVDANGNEHTIDRTMLNLVKSNDLPFSMSGMQYWDRHTNEANNMKRPYVMIRNPRL